MTSKTQSKLFLFCSSLVIFIVDTPKIVHLKRIELQIYCCMNDDDETTSFLRYGNITVDARKRYNKQTIFTFNLNSNKYCMKMAWMSVCSFWYKYFEK